MRTASCWGEGVSSDVARRVAIRNRIAIMVYLMGISVGEVL